MAFVVIVRAVQPGIMLTKQLFELVQIDDRGGGLLLCFLYGGSCGAPLSKGGGLSGAVGFGNSNKAVHCIPCGLFCLFDGIRGGFRGAGLFHGIFRGQRFNVNQFGKFVVLFNDDRRGADGFGCCFFGGFLCGFRGLAFGCKPLVVCDDLRRGLEPGLRGGLAAFNL